MSPSSTRWCPTPEQVMILEELYRRGVRTPNAPQIQRITAHLSFYGKIQGKNVFYWFQNHKARDRQKLRKKLLLAKQHHYPYPYPYPYPYQLQQPDPITHILPPQFPQLSHARYSPLQNHLHAQGTGISEEVPDGVMRRTDNWLMMMRSCGHDSTMISGAGPTSFSCCSSRTKPLETLQLFPLRSHADDQH